MLAKENKIKNLKRQREFIKKQLCSERFDGNGAYSYSGYVFPENIAYFQEEGYVVWKVEAKEVLANNNGLPIYCFSDCAVGLNEEELKRAESYPCEDMKDGHMTMEQLINELIGD